MSSQTTPAQGSASTQAPQGEELEKLADALENLLRKIQEERRNVAELYEVVVDALRKKAGTGVRVTIPAKIVIYGGDDLAIETPFGNVMYPSTGQVKIADINQVLVNMLTSPRVIAELLNNVVSPFIDRLRQLEDEVNQTLQRLHEKVQDEEEEEDWEEEEE